jgi:predicted enzyme related to lactoylglutathione lyase
MYVIIDAHDLPKIAGFWSEALGWPITYEEPDEYVIEPPDDAPHPGQVPLVFVTVPERKERKNRVHLDLASTSTDHQLAQVDRLQTLGASTVDIGQGDRPWVVMADPEGNEFCVLEPREYYDGVGPVAAMVMDCVDPEALAPFWIAASGWPEYARSDSWIDLRAPTGEGPVLGLLRNDDQKTVKNRVHIDVAPYPGDDHQAEVARLCSLGARPVDIGQEGVSWVVLADPEGNELCVLTPRE